MRRRDGDALVPNEVRLLATATLMRAETEWFHGYQLLKHLAATEGSPPMNHTTLYRALLRLQEAGLLDGKWEPDDEAREAGRERRPRRYYRLTPKGLSTARSELTKLAEDRRPTWVRRLSEELGRA